MIEDWVLMIAAAAVSASPSRVSIAVVYLLTISAWASSRVVRAVFFLELSSLGVIGSSVPPRRDRSASMSAIADSYVACAVSYSAHRSGTVVVMAVATALAQSLMALSAGAKDSARLRVCSPRVRIESV